MKPVFRLKAGVLVTEVETNSKYLVDGEVGEDLLPDLHGEVGDPTELVSKARTGALVTEVETNKYMVAGEVGDPTELVFKARIGVLDTEVDGMLKDLLLGLIGKLSV
jgi:hypothetical protein